MTTLLVATGNRHKADEIRALLSTMDVRTLEDFPRVGAIEEDQPTLEGNALKKAREAFRLTSIPTIADDTGLEVGYLNDEPGVFSSRYAGPGATYADNVRLLLRRLRGVPPRRRMARFRTVIAFIPGPGREQLVEGIVRGVIAEEPRGTGGFGYDPVFIPDGHTRTFAEMTLEEKNRVSHRAMALERLRPLLEAAR